MTGTTRPLILVVEDDQYCRELLEQILSLNGYTVQVAANGMEALEALEMERPHLILLDMKMPVMSGWEFSRRLKAKYDHLIPFIIVSAAEDIQMRAKETGANDWLEKPFELDQLLDKVKNFLRGASSL